MIFEIQKRFGPWFFLTGSLLILFSFSFASSITGMIYLFAGIAIFLFDPAVYYFEVNKQKRSGDLKFAIAYAGFLLSSGLFLIRFLIHAPADGAGYAGIIKNILLFVFIFFYVISLFLRISIYFMADEQEQSDRTNIDNRRKFMLNTLYSVVIGLLLFIFINYLAAVKNPALDLSPGYYSFGESSRTIIRSLDKEVEIYAFLPVQQASAARNRETGSPVLYRIAEDIKVFLEQLPVIQSGIKVTFLNADLEGPHLRDFPSAGNGTIIFRSKNDAQTDHIHSKSYTERILNITSEKDMETLERETVRLLIQVSSSSKKVCFTALNGEKELETKSGKILAIDGMNLFKKMLGYYNFNFNSLGMRSGWPASVPEDCSVLMIAGPVIPFSPESRNTLAEYLKNGGRAFITVNPKGSEDFSWLLKDKLNTPYQFQKAFLSNVKSFPGIPISDFFGKHRITENLTGFDKSIIVFPDSGYFHKGKPGSAQGDKIFNALTYTDILQAASNTFEDKNKNGVKDNGENSGNYVMGVAFEENKKPVLAVFSGTNWLTNAGFGFPVSNKNSILAADTLFWMTESSLAAGIPPEKRSSRSIQVTDDLKFKNMMLGVVVFPIFIILFSLSGVFYYRKQRTRTGF